MTDEMDKTVYPPEYMPSGEYTFTTEDILIFKSIPGVSHFKEGDGIILYYDQPLLFLAHIQEQLVIVSLIDEDFVPRAGGWKQYIAFPVTIELARQIYDSERPVRDFWEQENKDNWFIHNDWTTHLIPKDGASRRVWDESYKIYRNITVLDKWKPDTGVMLDSDAKVKE